MSQLNFLTFLKIGYSFFKALVEFSISDAVRKWDHRTDFGNHTIMISSKLLVFRGPRGALVTEPVEECQNRRRKKSCSDLFQNGYRVRLSTSQIGDGKERNHQNSLSSCLRVLSNWCK